MLYTTIFCKNTLYKKDETEIGAKKEIIENILRLGSSKTKYYNKDDLCFF